MFLSLLPACVNIASRPAAMSSSRPIQQNLFPDNTGKGDALARNGIVRIEKNLNTFGFFTPSSKKLLGVTSKTVTIAVRSATGQYVDARATIYPSAEFGLPTTADQDKYLAFQKLMEKQRGTDGVLSNPVRFTSSAMLEILRCTQGGKNYQEISDWLRRMTFTGIESEGVVYLAGRKKYARDMFHVFQRSVAIGEILEDGTVAQENYVWLSDWQLENLNNRHTLPIQYDLYRRLQLHIAKALVPLLQLWFFASRKLYTEKRYNELCSLLGIQQYRALSRIRQQVEPSLNELVAQAFLSNWEIAETADGLSYKLRLWAGSAFVSAADLRLGSQPRTLLPSAQNEAVEALVARGIREDKARQLLLNISEDQPVLDQIEWADAEIQRKRRTAGAIRNTAGFFIYVLQTNQPVPANFVSSRRRKLMDQVTQDLEQERRLETQRELEEYLCRERYEEYVTQNTDAYIGKHMAGDLLKRRLAVMRRKLVQSNTATQSWPEQVLDEYTQRLLREELAKDMELLSYEEFKEESQGRMF